MSKELPEHVVAVRALLMKLYHSRQIGEAFYHAALVNGEAPELERQGWIERHGDGWRLTDDGLHGWAHMNVESFKSDFYYVSEFWTEMREQLKATMTHDTTQTPPPDTTAPTGDADVRRPSVDTD